MCPQGDPNPGGCAETAASERRAAKRFESIREASCCPLTDRRAPHSARVRDVSGNGIGLLSAQHFEPGTVLLIQIHDCGQTLPPLLVGKVMHVTAQGDGTWHIGCALTRALTQSDLRALAEENWEAE